MRFQVKNILFQTKYIKNCIKYSTNIPESIIECAYSNDQKNENIQKKILYSSYLENQILKLGYKKNQILKNKLEKEEKRAQLENVNVKAFPSALKYLENEEEYNNINFNIEDEHNDNSRRIIQIRKQNYTSTRVPSNWLQDYEHYDEDENYSMLGTPDSSIPPSKVPCGGCGANLHCIDPGIPGYIPREIFRDRKEDELKNIICQRCHFLKEYNVAVDLTVPAEKYIEIVSSIQDKFALAILIVDLLDFPCSIWPGIQDILGNKRPIFVVGNKVDLLPKDSRNYLEHIKRCLNEAVVKAGLIEMNIKHTCLISAKTGYGVEELITNLHKTWEYKGDVYLVGCTNVGKSSLFNALLRSDYCKVQAVDLVKKATTCPWPGTTLNLLKFPILRPSDIRIYERLKRLSSERARRYAEAKLRRDQMNQTGKIEYATLIGHIGQTFYKGSEAADLFSMPQGSKPILSLNEKSKEFVNSKWCYDTPGVIQPDQIHNILTTEELLQVMPSRMMSPRVFKMSPGMTLFLAGLGRIDVLSSNLNYIRLSTYSSHALPILIVSTEDAEEMYEKFLGTEVLGVPCGNAERLTKWPGLKSSELIEIIGEDDRTATCDILLSSSGWIGVKIPRGFVCTFKAWTPEGRGIFVRKPPLIPFGEYLRGKKIRGSLAYRIGTPFIKQ